VACKNRTAVEVIYGVTVLEVADFRDSIGKAERNNFDVIMISSNTTTFNQIMDCSVLYYLKKTVTNMCLY
jgi:hypothetical protein